MHENGPEGKIGKMADLGNTEQDDERGGGGCGQLTDSDGWPSADISEEPTSLPSPPGSFGKPLAGKTPPTSFASLWLISTGAGLGGLVASAND